MVFGVLALIFVGSLLAGWFLNRPAKPYVRTEAGGDEARAIAERMKVMALPTLLLTAAETPGVSKLGGAPELPVGTEWPTGAPGSLAFLAQIDLAAVRAAGGPDWLPETGVIFAFLDDTRWGFRDLVTVLHAPEAGPAALLSPPSLSKRLRFPERRVGFLGKTSIPSLDWLGVDVRTLDVADLELDKLAGLPGEALDEAPLHRIGGYPDEIQDEQMALSCEYIARRLERAYGDDVPPEIENASLDWRLLLQVDSDSDLKMNWGDGGRLYVFIREADARVGNFTEIVTLSQSY